MSKVSYIDFKVISWERIWLKDTDETTAESIIAEIKNGLPYEEIPYENIKDQLAVGDYGPLQMNFIENDGYSTVEMYDEEDSLIYQNGK